LFDYQCDLVKHVDVNGENQILVARLQEKSCALKEEEKGRSHPRHETKTVCETEMNEIQILETYPSMSYRET